VDLKLERGPLGGWGWLVTEDGKFVGTGTAASKEQAADAMTETALEWLERH
jgi:hypothetical protein